MQNFDQLAYWNQRYEKQFGLSFDWLETYKQLRLIILKDTLNIYPQLDNCVSEWHQQNLIYDDAEQISVLDVGCGNSTLVEHMYDMDHFRRITAIDWSPQVID